MPHSSKSAQLSARIERAENLLKNIDGHIQDGNEGEVDSLSTQYEAALEAVFSYKADIAEDIMLKLNFIRRLVTINAPSEALTHRAFDSLEDDITQITALKG